MSWFEEQLRYREESDNSNLSDAIDSIADAVMGAKLKDSLSKDEKAHSAIDAILKYYHCKPLNEELPSDIDTVDKQIEYVIRPFGIKTRKVTLEQGWYKNAIGAILGTLKEDGSLVALIPGKISGYNLIDVATGKQIKLNKKTQSLLEREAICFYEPLPQKALTIKDLFSFMLKQLNVSDIVIYFALMGLSAALGLLSPLFSKWLFGYVLDSGSLQVLISLAVFMVSFSITQLCFNVFQNLTYSRIGIKQRIAVQAAVMNRILSLPTKFFKPFSSGELSQRADYVQSLCDILFDSIGTAGLTSIFSLIYIGQIFAFAPALVLPSLLIIIGTAVLSLITTIVQIRVTREKMQFSAETSGLTYATITGIQKIKLAGAEKRMFSRWASYYSRQAAKEYNPPIFLKLSSTLSLALTLFGTMVLYAIAIKSSISVADYYAFNTAYAMVSSAFMSVASLANTIGSIRPTLEMAKPILDAEPEVNSNKERVSELKGKIEISHISFRYDESMPNIFEDLSLKVNPGEYLAIVGPTGCGKSTLVRLLIGFETPQKGGIFFDDKDISKLDIESLRRKIGVVMQDSKLFAGDIFSNIAITAPEIGLDEAWEIAKTAAIADDIREMPMQMNTVVFEGNGGLSGGQKQRLMIARAIANKPIILIFDEATSELDNLTQKKVTEAIDSLECTRIVIAHRLSTIKHADRILYLDDGKILEEGTYDELMSKDGNFAKLVERQVLGVE